MTRVKKLYCAVHQKWYDPTKGPCPLCEKGEPGVPVLDTSSRDPITPLDMKTEFYAIPLESPDNLIMDQDTFRVYQEQLRKRAEETYRRIRLFRIINFIAALIFIIVFFILILI
ncbi:MAG: hypothetical protein ACTSYR_02875 [Candidatus Odinarchaeia archaeon]